MKTKLTGFTLIELLVVIVIIGILATISTSTFGSYFGKARDAVRTAAVGQMEVIIKSDAATKWDNTKYIYASGDATTEGTYNYLFAKDDYATPKAENDICYYIGNATGNGTTAGEAGDDNEFVVATWGETTSTAASGTEGVLAAGTKVARDALTADDSGLTRDDFVCAVLSTAGGNVNSKFTDATSGDQLQFYIGTSGSVEGAQ